MSVTTVRHGDIKPITWRLIDKATDEPLDLTGATVVIYAKPQRGGGAVITLAAVPLAPFDAGRVQHMQTGTLPVNSYTFDFDVSIAGEKITAPTIGAEVVVVLPRNGD